ncbi:MAG: hypothetical protein ACJ8AD_08125 [Gemmatimonadaceae bacterium]
MYSRDTLSLIVDDAAAGLTEHELSERLEEQLAGLSESERESFDDVLRTIGAGAQRALPGVIQGATTGAAAGPWGALIGGVAGGAASLATSGGGQQAAARPTRRPPPRAVYTAPSPPIAPSPVASVATPAPATAPPATPSPGPASTATSAVPAPSASSAPRPSAPAPTTNPAAQLLWAIQNPRVLQAVASLVAGPVGRQAVAVDDTSAARGAFLNMLNVLTSQASEQAEMYAEAGHDEYLRDGEGDYAWDVMNPEARARALLARLRNEERPRDARDDSAGAWLLRSGLAELDAELSW